MGGCDGCFNAAQDNNAGLNGTLVLLENTYKNLSLADMGISRADFWAFVGMVTVEKATALQDG